MAESSAGARSVVLANLSLLAACIALAMYVFGSADQPPPKLGSPLSAVPSGAAIVVTIDVEALRRGGLGSWLGTEHSLPGVGSLEEVCGFDPTDALRAVAVALPQVKDGSDPDFGVVATGSFDSGRITECASRVIARRGDKPTVSRVGSFVTIRAPQHSSGEVAVKDGGPVLVGGGDYLRGMIDAADGHVADVTSDEVHVALRSAVGDGAVVASAVLPPEWLVTLTGTPRASASPLASVRAAALLVEVSPRIELTLLMGCLEADSCAALADSMQELKSTLGRLVDLRIGLPLTRRIQVTQQPQQVRLKLRLAPGELDTLVQKLLAEPAPPQ